MAITDIEAIGDSPYCKIGEDVFLWDYIAQNVKDASVGNMCDLYPGTYKTMTEVPDELDLGNRTSLNEFFTKSLRDYHYKKDYVEGDIQDGDGGCRALLAAPMMNTNKITDMRNMFGGIDSIQLTDGDTGDSVDFDFYNACVSMTFVPQYDTSNVTNFQHMFAYCENLRDVPELDTSSGTNFIQTFMNCTSLPKQFPWAINIDGITSKDALAQMFEGSSVEDVVFVRFNNVYTTTYDWAKRNLGDLTLNHFDSSGTLKRVIIGTPGYYCEYYIVDENGSRLIESEEWEPILATFSFGSNFLL